MTPRPYRSRHAQRFSAVNGVARIADGDGGADYRAVGSVGHRAVRALGYSLPMTARYRRAMAETVGWGLDQRIAAARN